MRSEETPKQPNPQAPVRRNTGLHGAFWTRFLLKLMRFLPKPVCLALTWPVSLIIYALARPQRQAVLANLAALEPSFGPTRRWWAGYQVFAQFALTYLDRLWHMHFGREIAWQISDLSQFEAMKENPGGVLIFTIHSGNYDIGASLFATKFGRTLHTVRVPEQTAELQKLRAAELQHTEQQNPRLRVHYNESDSHLGMELCRILMASEAVAVQGDRVVNGVSPMEMAYQGRSYKIPRGPLVLAEISRVPCYPIFLERLGCLRYRIIVKPPFYDGGARVKADELGQAWLPVLADHLRDHWDQWFVFEHLVSPASSPA
jgi:predicted LPLAT superfamily acyltransferase